MRCARRSDSAVRESRFARRNGPGLIDRRRAAVDICDAFYATFVARMHDLGSPVARARIPARRLRRFGARARIVLVRQGPATVGGDDSRWLQGSPGRCPGPSASRNTLLSVRTCCSTGRRMRAACLRQDSGASTSADPRETRAPTASSCSGERRRADSLLVQDSGSWPIVRRR